MKALATEVKAHKKNGTLGPAISSIEVPAGFKPIPLDVLSSVNHFNISSFIQFPKH